MRDGGGPQPVAISVVVVSHKRPTALRRCLLSLWLQDHPEMEVIVVADAPGLEAIATLPFVDWLKTCRFDTPGISEARNRGIALAAGEVVAFVDDDSAARPDWASRLSAAFADPGVTAATGHVLGRNGVSLQWQGTSVDRLGQDRPLSTAPDMRLPDGACVKLLGTNMAIRREDLLHLGGFDPGYRYFMDDTDLSLRIAAGSGGTTVIAGAQVQHDFLANACRRADRAPADLTEIGAGSAYFLRRHCPPARRAAALRALRQEMRRRAMPHLVSGALEPADIARLMVTFDSGAREGAARPTLLAPPLPSAESGFVSLRPGGCSPARAHVLEGSLNLASSLYREAGALAAEGHSVLVKVCRAGAGRRDRRFTDEGFWLESECRTRVSPWGGLARFLPFRTARGACKMDNTIRTCQ
jgi:hypothetical protein